MYTKENESSDSRKIGNALKVIRKSNNLSQTKIADEFGLTFQQWQKYEKGSNRISYGRIKHFLNVTNCSLQEFEDLINENS